MISRKNDSQIRNNIPLSLSSLSLHVDRNQLQRFHEKKYFFLYLCKCCFIETNEIIFLDYFNHDLVCQELLLVVVLWYSGIDLSPEHSSRYEMYLRLYLFRKYNSIYEIYVNFLFF